MKKRNGNNWFRIIKTIAPINNKRQHSVQRNFIFMQKNPKKTKTTQAKRKTCSWDFPFQLNWVEFDSVFFLLLREILLLAEIFHVSLVDDRYFCPRKYFGKWFILFYICVCVFFTFWFFYLWMINDACIADDICFYFVFSLCTVLMYSFQCEMKLF